MRKNNRISKFRFQKFSQKFDEVNQNGQMFKGTGTILEQICYLDTMKKTIT